MLVVQDQDGSDESGGELNDEQNRVNEVRLKRKEAARPAKARNSERDELLRQQQEHANVVAARNFLKMSEQRDSVGSGVYSARSSLGPNMEDYINAYKSEKDTNFGGKKDQGLTEQVIKKNTLDKGNARPFAPDASENFDTESQRPERSVISQRAKENHRESNRWPEGSEYSREYSQNVEVNSNRTSEFKYILGGRVDGRGKDLGPNTVDKSSKQKEEAV